jgi:hypothetical protein
MKKITLSLALASLTFCSYSQNVQKTDTVKSSAIVDSSSLRQNPKQEIYTITLTSDELMVLDNALENSTTGYMYIKPLINDIVSQVSEQYNKKNKVKK